MTRQTLSRWALLVGALVLTMVLAGCGGDDGVSPSTHQEALDRAAAEEAARLAAEEAARLAAEEAAAEEAARLAAEEAARLAAEEAAAEEAARLAAEEAARLAAEEAAREAAARAEAERQAREEEAARLAAEEAAREKAAEEAAAAARTAAINEAEMALATAQGVLMGLADDATYEAKRDAHRGIEAAATALRNVLAMNGGTDAQQDEAFATALEAGRQATALQQMIDDAATAMTEAQMEAINTAQTGLDEAAAALAELAEDASDEAMRDAQRAVQHAADALVTALTDNEGTAEQIAAAEMQRDSAMMMADDLDAAITAAAAAAAAAEMLAEQRTAIADAIAAAQMAVNAVSNASTDEEIAAAGVEIAKVTTAIEAASNVPASEKTANSATVSALTAQLESAKASRMAAMEAAAQAQRMANIEAAEMVLETAQAALMALGDDATDEQKLEAQAAIAEAATSLRNVLAMNGGTDAQRDAAFETALEARNAVATLRATIAARAAAAEAARMAAINTAQTALTEAEAALMGLADDATDEAKRDAQRAVQHAADALVTALMNNEGTAEQIAAAETKRDSAMTMADNLQAMITEAAEAAAQQQMIADQRTAVADAIAAAMDAVAAVMDDSSDDVVSAADAAIAAATAAINAATALPVTETAANSGTVSTLMTQLATAKASRTAAMNAAAAAEEAARIAELAAGERTAITTAIATATDAVAAVMDDSADDIVMAADAAVAAATKAIADAANVSDTEKITHTATVSALAVQLATAKNNRLIAMDRAEMQAQRMAVIQEAIKAINAATTREEAEAAYESVQDKTVAEDRELMTALDDRMANFDTADRQEAQMTALMTAADGIDTSNMMTAEEIAAANQAIYALKMAIEDAMDVSDDDKAMYQKMVETAEANVMTSQSALDHNAQMTALASAVTALQALDLSNLTTQEDIDAAQAAIDGLQTALDAATELSDTEKVAAMVELATANRTVMMAQGRFDINSQLMALSNAHDALKAIDLNNLMTQAQIDEADKAIVALDLALDAATDLTAAQKLDATADVTVAKRSVGRAQTALNNNIQMQRTAIMDAVEALGDIDLDDLDTADKIDAAQDAIDDLQMALDGATHLSDDAKAMYQTQLTTATETVKTARTGMGLDERMMTQRTALANAVTTARTAVNGVDNDSTDTEVSAADSAIAALEKAIADAVDLPAGSTDVAQGTLETLKGTLATAKTARTAYLADKSDMDDKAMAKLGKDLHAALASDDTGGATPLTNIDLTALALSATGLTIDATAGAGALATGTDPAAVTLEAGDSVTALDGWMGMDYALTTGTGTSKLTNEARVYTNQGPGELKSFTELSAAGDAGYTIIATGADKGYVSLVAAGTVETGVDLKHIMAATFEHSGTQNHPVPARADGFYTRGTYDGAPGEYRCTGTCSSTNDGKDDSPDTLGGTWHFKPDAGANAMARQPDAEYLYYGWWVSKDDEDVPTAASAFVGVIEPSAGDLDTGGDLTALTGSATYVGHAAGKFAIDNVLAGVGNGGHFTADAELKATFGTGTTAGVTGTIDNFRLNDGSEDPGWIVSLARGGLGSSNGSITAPTASTTGPTVWSINGNKAPASGTWSGTMYDELPGNAPDGDGSNIPTTVTGTFYSEFSTIGRMVGGFGADKQ